MRRTDPHSSKGVERQRFSTPFCFLDYRGSPALLSPGTVAPYAHQKVCSCVGASFQKCWMNQHARKVPMEVMR